MFKRLLPILIAVSVLPVSLVLATPASAAGCPLGSPSTACPGWEIASTTYPTNLKPGGKGAIQVQPLNVGAVSSSGTITIEDVLPRGLTATDAGTFTGGGGHNSADPEAEIDHTHWECSISRNTEELSVVTCHNGGEMPSIEGGAGLPTSYQAGKNLQPPLDIAVQVEPGVEGQESNRMRIEGGGALNAVSAVDPVTIAATSSGFGLARWDGWFSNANGTLDTQAGSVPYAATFSFDLNTLLEGNSSEATPAGGEARNFEVNLPPGFVGNPQATVQCTQEQFDEEKCPRESIIGDVEPITALGADLHRLVFNLVPPTGDPAEFAFTFEGISVFLDPVVRSGSDYGITTRVNNAPQRVVIASVLTLWGVPDDPSHDPWRCGSTVGCNPGEGTLGSHPVLKPFLRMPTSCGTPDSFGISVSNWFDELDSFTEPIAFPTHGPTGQPAGLTECGKLPFNPGVQANPTTNATDSPSGLKFDLHVEQPEGVTTVETAGETSGAEPELHEADLKDATITFPAGLSVNPSEADGLQACSEAQVGFTGFKELNPTVEPGVSTSQFTPEPVEASGQEEEEARNGVPGEPRRCPNAAKLGTVEVNTPLIAHPLPGGIYLAKQGENPFGSLLALYITVYDPASGVVVKLPGKIEADPVTGQLTVSVQQNPQVPFEDFKISLFEGTRSPLTTPTTCGTFSTTSSLTPWSSPEAPSVSPEGSFAITEAPGGGACPAAPGQGPNAPGFSAGTFTPIAGTYSPFVLHLSREDGSQQLRALNVTLPPGLIGKIAGIAQCPQANIEAAEHRNGLGQGALEATAPSCPAASEVGSAHIGAGSGAPFYVTGHAYLAGPYRGAPFSILVITPAVAGPFDLGTVVVRSALFINPLTAQVSVQSDPFPTILDGIPLDLRNITVEITRSQFTLNPTSCSKMAVTGSSTGETSQAPLSYAFQVGGCTGLPFKPTFTASTQGKASKAKGASLSVKLTANPGEANVGKVDVQIPSQLPSRLSTLQKACTEAQFNTNPAGCPTASDVATATVHTPILNVPLTGPVYFVSHGGAAFPELVLVLQGEGVTIDLVGNTDIKGKVTYSRFEAVPDAPFTTFELNAPQGPYSILGANVPASAKYSLCGQTLTMPTVLTGQNGVVVKQTTKLAITGCAKVVKKALTRAQKLAKALKACKGDKRKAKRQQCERQARKKFGPIKKHSKRKGKLAPRRR
jgi:hypothetical protein